MSDATTTNVRPVFRRVASRHAGYSAAHTGSYTGRHTGSYTDLPSVASISSASAPPVTIFNTPTAFGVAKNPPGDYPNKPGSVSLKEPASLAPFEAADPNHYNNQVPIDSFAVQSQTMDMPAYRDMELARALGAAARFSQEGAAYLDQGKFDEAERLFTLAFNISQSYLGPTSPGLALALERLASFYLYCGHYNQAAPLLKRLYDMRVKQHADGLTIHTNISARENYQLMAQTVDKCSNCLEHLGLLDACETIYLTLLKSQEEHYSHEHNFTLDALERLGNFYLRARVYGLAQVVFEKLYQTKIRIYGEISMEVSEVLSNLSLIYFNLEMFHAQVSVLERQVALLDTVHGGTGLSLASALSRLADALAIAAQDEEDGVEHDDELIERAELIYRRALTIYEKHYGPATQTVVNLRNRLKALS